MEIGDYLRIFRRFWWVVLLATLLGAGVGYGTTFLSSPKYQSTATLFVTTQSGTSVGDAYQNNMFSQDRVVSYAGLATSEQVAARAVDQLKAPISADQLRGKISAKPREKTVLLDIAVTDKDAATAQSYANAVADQLVQVASELETSRRGGTPAAGAILVDEASYPTKPAGTSLLMRIAYGAAGGFAVGLVLAVLAGVRDTRLRRPERVEAVTDSVVLGSLVADKAHSGAGVIDLNSGNVAAERVRELRTNLQFARTDDGARPHVIAVTSPSSSDGRSTTAVDLAAAFAEIGRSVVLVDGDLINPSLSKRLQLSDNERARASQRGLSTVLAGQHDLTEALIENAGRHPWALLPAGPVPSVRRQLWGGDSAVDMIETLRRNFEFVIIDTPPLTECSDGALAAALGDGAIVLSRIGHTRAPALRRALEILRNAHATVIGAVVTCETGPRGEQSRNLTAAATAARTEGSNGARPQAGQPGPAAPPAESDAAKATAAINLGDGSADVTAASRRDGAHRMARTRTESR